VGFSKARFVLRRQTVSDPFRVQKHFLGAGILRVKGSYRKVGPTLNLVKKKYQNPVNLRTFGKFYGAPNSTKSTGRTVLFPEMWMVVAKSTARTEFL